MILAIKWAREQKIPFLGICLGFQLAVVEWARNVMNLPGSCAPVFSFPMRRRLFLRRRQVERVRQRANRSSYHIHAGNFTYAHGWDDAPWLAAYIVPERQRMVAHA